MTAATATADELLAEPFLSEGRTARTDLGIWSKLFRPSLIRKPLDSSTAIQPDELAVKHEIEQLFSMAREETLEDGIESEFSNGLLNLVLKYDEYAMDGITSLMFETNCNEELVSQALRWLGRMEHLQSYDRRLWLLERSLNSPSPRIRDAASVALASLDDTHAISFLSHAIAQEECEELRDDMTQVLDQLKQTLQCR